MNTTVVVGYDQTGHSDAALDVAAGEAVMRGASLTVVTAFRRPAPAGSAVAAPPDPDDAPAKAAMAVAEYGADRARARHSRLIAIARTVDGPAGKSLAQAAHGAGLLVLGSRDVDGFAGMQLGSTSMRALAEACCPVLVVRGAAEPADDRVVAAVDIVEPCEVVLDFAYAEAGRRGVPLTVLHVWDEPWILAYGQEDPGIADDIALIEGEREDRLLAAIRTVQRRHPGVSPFHQVATGSAANLLVEASRRAGLLVTGARRNGAGRHGMRLGPVTLTLLHHAECPVAVVPLDQR